MIGRYAATLALASGVTFGLFYLMQFLVSMQDARLDDAGDRHVVDFVRLKKDSDTQLKKRTKPEKQEPPEPPPPPDLRMARSDLPDQALSGVSAGFEAGLDLGGIELGAPPSDTDIIPLVRVEPLYPVRAQSRGIEGWVEVEFTISAAGTVKDATVIAHHPNSIFDRAALRAVSKWKYNPKIEDGVAVERPGVKVRLAFELEDS